MAKSSVTPVDLISGQQMGAVIAKVSVDPPAMTRLEPQSVSGDPRFGAEAAVADPLWMIGRQWQLGELLGEDVGSPVSVEVTSRVLPVTAWAPTGRTDGTDARVTDPPWRPWPEGAVLDELVEDTPHIGYERGVRWRSETGAQLVEMLHEAGHAAVIVQLLKDHPLTLPKDPADPDGHLDPTAERLHSVLAGRVPDGGTIQDALEAGEPGWVSGAANPGAVRDIAAAWLAWVQGASGSGGAWTTTRLEHRFRLRFGHGAAADCAMLEATSFGAGSARWHHFDWLEGQTVRLNGDDALADPKPRTDVMLATPLRYPGMPADRYWQLEDSSVDVAAIEAQPHDLARLCLAEFALASGDDWLVIPVDGQVGALNQVLRVRLTTTFGETLDIAENAEDRRAHGFRMFEVTSAGGHTLPGIVLPPIAHTPLQGDAVEEVAFIRDEMANMAWAVERVVPGRSGDPRLRANEPDPKPPAPPDDLVAGDLLYELMVPVPDRWIPLVAISTGYGEVAFRKGAVLRDDKPVVAESLLLEPTPLTFPAEEIPREGIIVRSVPLLARRRDGTYARWVGHRVHVGRGEGSSGLAFDAARDVRG